MGGNRDAGRASDKAVVAPSLTCHREAEADKGPDRLRAGNVAW